MTRTGLTEQEENQILLLLEGDISDIEIQEDDSDEDMEDAEETRLQNLLDPEPDGTDEQQILPDLQVGLEVNQETNDWEEDDNISLSALLAKEKRPTNSKLKASWSKCNLEEVDIQCDVSYTHPEAIKTPLNYFKTFFDDKIIDKIVNETNLYSVQKDGTSINTSFAEISQFFGIQILSGIVRMPSYRMYWANETRFAPIADVMSRNRFDKLRNYLHLNDNTRMKARNEENYDKLFKVRPLIDSLKENFSKIEPEDNNSVDEIMIPFKGRNSLKQYVKNKPHKWGIKMFARAGVSGIVYDFEIYVGKETIKNASSLGISGDIVIRLVENLPRNKNFKVFFDNWFTSYDLLVHLKEIGLLATGTVRINRMRGCKLKSDETLKNEGRGSYDFCTDKNRNIVAVKWFDNKPVHVASSYQDVAPVENVKRWSLTEKKYIDIPRPAIIKEYNLNMGGVDLNDMLVALYRIKLGVRRYYLRIVYHLIDICVVNAWLLYRRDCQQHQTKYKRLIVFRSEIAHALMHEFTNFVRKKVGRPSTRESSSTPEPPQKRRVVLNPIDDLRYDNISHWPEHIEPKKRCRNCIKAYTRTGCMKCGIPLCLTKDKNCFVVFHTR